MFAAIATLIASLGVLVGSNGQAVDSWSAPPSTYLAVFTAIANLGMRYACMQGVVIAWWVRALRGSTLTKLHHDWRSGTTLRGALTAGRHMGLLGLACIFSTLVVIDGPLLQRSSTVVIGSVAGHPVPLNVTMVPELPAGWSGGWLPGDVLGTDKYWNYGAFNATMPSGSGGNISNNVWSNMNRKPEVKISQFYFGGAQLTGVVSGCEGTCKATLRAPALAQTVCTTWKVPVDYNGGDDAATFMDTRVAPPHHNIAFFVASTLVPQQEESITLMTGHAHTTGCAGTLSTTACDYVSAIGDYNVTIENDIITIDDPGHPAIVALANNTATNRTINSDTAAYDSTLAGIEGLFHAKWKAANSYLRINGTIQSLSVAQFVDDLYMYNSEIACPSFRDPHGDMVEQLNSLMVYFGFAAAGGDPEFLASHLDSGVEINATTIGYPAGTESVYHTEYVFFIAAMIVELICVLLVAPTYWDWWKLGRAVSFSPLEIAKAFESPLLADCNSNSSGRDMARRMSKTRIQYGATASDDPEKTGTKLAFADPDVVEKPRRGTLIDI